MLIRYGYDITVTCDSPTPMICLMEVRLERVADTDFSSAEAKDRSARLKPNFSNNGECPLAPKGAHRTCP